MGFAKRLLSSVGVGAATVETRLEKDEFSPGEEVRGVIEITGGNLRQEVEGIHLRVESFYDSELGSSKVLGTVGKFPAAPAMTVEAGSRREVSFSFRLPYETPLTIGSSEVLLRASLDVRSAFDPEDKDLITVRPDATTRTILDAIERLGFELREAKNKEVPDRFRRNLHFGQEFEFVPKRGEFEGRLDELELLMFPSEGAVDLAMQVDRRGFRGESYAEITVSDGEAAGGLDLVAETLADSIRRYA
jgi:sporulation-control protein